MNEKEICEVPETQEAPETPTRSASFQSNAEKLKAFTPKEKAPKVADTIAPSSTAIGKLKSLAETLGETDGSLVSAGFISGAFEATQHAGNRGDFEIQETQELASSWGNREDQHIAYGAEASAVFEIDEESEKVTEFVSPKVVTIDEVKALQAHVGGVIQQQVNFDMLNEVREAVYNAKYELSRVTGAKEELLEESSRELSRLQTYLEGERRERVVNSIQGILSEICAEEWETWEPEAREAYHSAIKELKIAEKLVKKAGFASIIGPNEAEVIRRITAASKLFPKIQELIHFRVLANFWNENGIDFGEENARG